MFSYPTGEAAVTSQVKVWADYLRTKGLSFGNLDLDSEEFKEKTYSTIDVVLSAFLILIVVGILMYFTG